MARRSKQPSSSPNTILVVFLVLFILSNIGFAVWVVNLFGERDKWDKDAKANADKATAADTKADFWKLYASDLRAAVGDPEFFNKNELPTTWREKRKLAVDDKSMFTDEPEYNEFIATVRFAEDSLGAYQAGTGYPKKFKDLPGPLGDKLLEVQGKLAKQEAEYRVLVAEKIKLEKNYANERLKLHKMITEDNEKVLKKRQDDSTSLAEFMKQNEDMRKEIGDKAEEQRVEMAKLLREVKALQDKLKEQEAASKNPNRALGEPHALVLDLSKGKPLWDLPRGKITKVDTAAQRVHIDRGSKDGVKTGLTFNVFAPSPANRADGKLKATIEVISVTGEHSAQCRVNSYFTDDPREPEVPVDKISPTGLSAGVIVEGDLLFNMFWGSHVALAGIVDFTGLGTTSPAAQMDNLFEFIRYLERIGVTVDAYVDLRDGKLVGELKPDTNYLIRGANAASLGATDSDARVKGINDGIKAMLAQSVDRGLFIISPDNFAVVTGYRRPGSADRTQTMTFSPTRPGVGTGIVGDTGPNGTPKKN